MSEEEIIEAIGNLNDRTQILNVLKYTESLITTKDGIIYEELTSACNFCYGDKPIDIEDFDEGELTWLK